MIINIGRDRDPVYDNKAARQRFDGESSGKSDILTVPPDSVNPIDVTLRMFATFGNGTIDMKGTFFNKWAAVMTRTGIKVGRIIDLFASRDVRLKDKYGKDVIASFENVIELSEKEL